MAQSKQLYWEDVEVGSEVTTLPKIAHTQMLVKWAGASGDFNPHHYDDQTPLAGATNGIIVHGALKRQWLVQLMTDWIGLEGRLTKFSCQYRGVDYPRRMKDFVDPLDGETWQCKGTVTNKADDDLQSAFAAHGWQCPCKWVLLVGARKVITYPYGMKGVASCVAIEELGLPGPTDITGLPQNVKRISRDSHLPANGTDQTDVSRLRKAGRKKNESNQ